MLRKNSAEGGTNGVTVTQGVGGNSGGFSGDYFDGVTIAGASALTFDNTHARELLSYKIAPASNQANYLQWDTQMGTVTTVYGRFYIWLDVSPANSPILAFRSGAGQAARLVVNPAGTINWKDAANVDIAGTTTAALTVSQWYRFEYKVIFSATVGQVFLNYYLGDSTTAIETLTSAATAVLMANADTMRIGRVAGVANTYIVWLDNILVNDTGFPGPAITPHDAGASAGVWLPTAGAVYYGSGDS